MAPLVLALAVAFYIPSSVGAGWLSTFTTCAIFAIAAAGTGLLYGELGLTSFAQVSLMGVGGWTALRLEFAYGLPFPVTVLVAAAVTALVGLVVGLPALRLRGLYLALVTLMVAGGLDQVFTATGFPNGADGFLGYASSGQLQRMSRPDFAVGDVAYFRLALAVMVALFVVVRLHVRARPGRAWALIARSEGAAHSAGIHVTAYKVWALALAGALSGVAGALLAGQIGQLSPAPFDPAASVVIFALTLVGGARHWAGWVIAALLFEALPALFDEWSIDGNVALMISGAALVINLIGAPDGIVGELAKARNAFGARRRRRRGRRETGPAPSPLVAGAEP